MSRVRVLAAWNRLLKFCLPQELRSLVAGPRCEPAAALGQEQPLCPGLRKGWGSRGQSPGGTQPGTHPALSFGGPGLRWGHASAGPGLFLPEQEAACTLV